MNAKLLAALAALTMAVCWQAEAAWETGSYVDEWGDRTGEKFAVSSAARDPSMGFPYQRTEAHVRVDCHRVHFVFTTSPNLNGGSTLNGYNKHRVRVRIDGKVTDMDVYQTWGSKTLTAYRLNGMHRRLAGGRRLDLALSWYGQGAARFSWDLAGFAKAISELPCVQRRAEAAAKAEER